MLSLSPSLIAHFTECACPVQTASIRISFLYLAFSSEIHCTLISVTSAHSVTSASSFDSMKVFPKVLIAHDPEKFVQFGFGKVKSFKKTFEMLPQKIFSLSNRCTILLGNVLFLHERRMQFLYLIW